VILESVMLRLVQASNFLICEVKKRGCIWTTGWIFIVTSKTTLVPHINLNEL
jgi:hypothetical protein